MFVNGTKLPITLPKRYSGPYTQGVGRYAVDVDDYRYSGTRFYSLTASHETTYIGLCKRNAW